MLKKRILASSMASVMALSTVSVVAFADETATDVKTEAVTKAVLKEYVASFDGFLKADIYEYGTTQADQFQDAIDYAENVIADGETTEVEWTAAYQMLKAVYESLEIHTAEELQALIDDYKDIYDSENILNEDLNDNIYDQDTYDDFTAAYDVAESYVNSEDGRLITDAYIDLAKAKKDLVVLDSVSKQDFRTALRDFEAIATKLASNETWRRGTVSVNPETGTNYTADNAPKKKLADAYFVTFGQLKDIVYGDSDVIVVKNNLLEDLNGAGKTWIATDGTTVKDYVEDEYERFDKIQSSNKTTDKDIVLACKAAKEAVAVFNSWKADDTTRAAKASINNLISTYRAKLVRDYCSGAGEMTTKIAAFIDDASKLPAYTAGKTEWKTAAEITLILDKKTDLIALNNDGTLVTVVDETKHYEKKIAKDQDIMKYIPVLSAEVQNDIPATVTAATPKQGIFAEELYRMLAIVEKYNAADAETDKDDRAEAFEKAYETDAPYVGLDAYDENNIVAVPAGSRNEYTLINRKLTYVLEDIYSEKKTDKYTKRDVSNLIEKAYDLCDKTGDSEVFALYHIDVVNERKNAIDWLTDANATKGYKEGDTVNGMTATDAYNALNDEIKDLEKMYKAYPMSYGDIAELIAETAAAIDSGVYGASADVVKKALTKVSVGLSTLEAKQDENQPFTYDREFVAYNRLLENETAGVYETKVKPNDAEKQLKKDIDALKTAVEDALKAPEKPEVVKGDLDGDGKYSPADARAALELFLAGEYNEAADMDGNGIVNAKDARAILELWLQA